MKTIEVFVQQNLRYGRNMATTRKELTERTGLPDRTIRRIIESAREDGIVIISSPTGEGYYLADSDEDLLMQYKLDYARAMSILKRLTPLRRALRKKGLI